MDSKEAQSLRDVADEKYGSEVDRITKNNLNYATKCAGIIKMLESYYWAYTQNQKEMLNLCHKVVMEQAEDDGHRKSINRTTKNKHNKIKNLDAQFDKFVKKFLKEFTDLFNNEDLEEYLLDAFDKFWDDNVLIEDKCIKVKGNVIRE